MNSAENRYVFLADGRKVPFDEYTEQSREFILDVSHKGVDELLRIWIDKGSRHELRESAVAREQDFVVGVQSSIERAVATT